MSKPVLIIFTIVVSLIITFAVLIIIAYSLLIFLAFHKQDNSQQPTIIQEPGDIVGSCDTLSEYEKERCLILEASLTKNIEICNQVEPVNKNECILNVAINVRNPNLCDNLLDAKECKESYAINVLDSTYCGDTENCKAIIQRALTKYTIQYSDCEALNYKVKDSGFPGSDDHTEQQQCFEFVAFLELEPQYCDKINYYENAIETCQYLAQRKDTENNCISGWGYGIHRDVCYYRLAKQENSQVFCDKIVLGTLKDRCINAFNR